MRNLFIFLSFLLSFETAYAAQMPLPPTLAVKSYVLKDFNSGAVMAQQHADQRVEPASLTKVMTAYLVFNAIKVGHLKLNQTLPVSDYAWKGGGGGCGGGKGSCMFIDPKSIVTVDELLRGMIIVSGNDASVALAEGLAGTEEAFADLMNKEAQRLGMKSSHFMNSTGLPDEQHYTTATDLSILATALIRDFPEEYQRYYSQKDYIYKNIRQENRNTLLLKDSTVDGMKTGHTESAGYCLITSAKRGARRLISVVLGAPSKDARASESQRLLNYGYQFFDTTLVYKKGQEINTLRVWKGQSNQVKGTVENDLYLTLPKGQYAQVKATLTSMQPLVAPINTNQIIGKISFKLGGKLILEQAIVAANAVDSANIFGRIWDSLRLVFHKYD